MPTVREYRIVLPLSMEEFELGRRWHKVEQIKLEMKLCRDETTRVTEFGERTLLREKIEDFPGFNSESFAKENRSGEHIIKGYGSSSLCSKPVPFPFMARVGSFMDILITKGIRLTQVESWEAYPYFRSISSNGSLGSSYKMVIDGICVPGNASEDEKNPLRLPEHVIENRKLVVVDIAKNVAAEDYRNGKDPVLFRSKKTGRGPLKPGVWMDETKPCITCCILVSVHFDLLVPFGVLTERKLHEGLHRAMILHHRELYCYMDKWIDRKLGVLTNKEIKLQAELEEIVQLKLQGGDKQTKTNENDTVEAPPGDQMDKSLKSFPTQGCFLEGIKSQFESFFSPNCAGGSTGYSFIVLGLLLCILAFALAYISQIWFS